jgi:prepilin signal peptidase PulO-like enzyme (type II secretory pathway)
VGLGQGDIKLLSTFGTWFGFKTLFILPRIASFLGLGWAFKRIVANNATYNTPIPFGVLF